MLQADVAAGPDVRAAVPASRMLHLEVEIRSFRAVVENQSIVGVYVHAPGWGHPRVRSARAQRSRS
jgi:hypothetical protein